MFTLMQLPYKYTALEPYIDALTVETHYSKHHAGYVKKLNTALEGHEDLLKMDLVELLKNYKKLVPQEKQSKVFNVGGQTYNHNIYWESLSPDSTGEPEGEISQAIDQTFGSFTKLKEELNNLATSQFGSGWAWLSLDENKNLKISSTSNADSPIFHGETPLMTIDVWEHAYYLKYKNLRADYIDSFWNLVNWKEINKKYLAAK